MLHETTTLRASIDASLNRPMTELVELHRQWIAAKEAEEAVMAVLASISGTCPERETLQKRWDVRTRKTQKIVAKMLVAPVRSVSDMAVLADLSLHYDTRMEPGGVARRPGAYDGHAHILRLVEVLKALAPGVEIFAERELNEARANAA
jgi:hypothetical protein